MRKALFSLGTILMCVLMASCVNPYDKLESMIDDLKENGKGWDADQWETFLREAAENELSFWESEPSKEDIKAYDKLGEKAEKALTKVLGNSKAQKAFSKAAKALSKDDDFKDLEKKSNKAEKAARKAAKKNSKKDKDDDEDDDDDDEDEDDDE